mmetsp:Transcript_19115/g.51105  ORF Transcript_19115/g.51105 Transcript_19115/m.51105 type:complete len:350 (+) Transcript_19115:386-1435(+)
MPHVSAIPLIKVPRACCTSLRPRATSCRREARAKFVIPNVQLQQRLMQAPLPTCCSFGALWNCNSKDEVTTDTDDIAMALPHTQGANGSLVNKKKTPAARGMPRALYESEKRKFSLILRNIALHKCSATTTSNRTDFTRTMSAASIAISVPAPMAIPRSAWARAGASLTPSPTIATQRGPPLRGSRTASKPLALGSIDPSCSKRTVAAFSEGSTRATTWLGLMPTLRATARAVLSLSPVSITTSLPMPLSALMVDLASGFSSSAIATINKMLSFTATYTTDLPSPSNCSCSSGNSAAFPGAPHTAPTLRSQVMLPIRMVRPPTTASNPLPGIARNSSASANMVTFAVDS